MRVILRASSLAVLWFAAGASGCYNTSTGQLDVDVTPSRIGYIAVSSSSVMPALVSQILLDKGYRVLTGDPGYLAAQYAIPRGRLMIAECLYLGHVKKDAFADQAARVTCGFRDLANNAQVYRGMGEHAGFTVDGDIDGALRRAMEHVPRTGHPGEVDMSIDMASIGATRRVSAPGGQPATEGPPDRRAGAVVITGSAFFVNETAVAVTNAHVVEGCDDVSVGAGHDAGDVIARDVATDLAAIQVHSRARTTAATLADKGASLGEAVVAAGYPLSGLLSAQLNVTIGNVSSLAGPREDTRVFQITAPIQPGNSGGPVLGPEGTVVGVVRATLNPRAISDDPTRVPQNVNFAIKASLVRAFLDAHGIEHARRAVAARAQSTTDVANGAALFTTFVECRPHS